MSTLRTKEGRTVVVSFKLTIDEALRLEEHTKHFNESTGARESFGQRARALMNLGLKEVTRNA